MKKYISLLFVLVITLFVTKVSAQTFTYTVTSISDANVAGSLRQAIQDAQSNIAGISGGIANAGPSDIINFNIGGAGPYTIPIASVLPTLNGQNIIIDATSQTGWTGTPLVIIRGTSSAINQAFQINGGTYTIKGIIFQNLQQGININGGTGHNVQNCWFGIDSNGSTKVGNTLIYQGIAIGVGTNATSGGGTAATNVTIGGSGVNDKNVLSGCLSLSTGDNTKRGAIQLGAGCWGTVISGNILGLNPTGTSNTNLGNGFFPYLHHNIYMLGTNTVPTTRVRITNNVISNCVGNGIWLEGGYNGTVITGNKIGTDLAGTTPMGNQAGGIRIDGAGGVPNVASDSHFIGVDETLSVGVSNSNRNIISGNGGAPDVRNCRANAFNAAAGCGAQYLAGCAPTSNCPDKYDGTLQCGIYLLGSLTTTIANNFIGTDITGNATITASSLTPYNGLGNLYAGIKIEGNATGNTIGGNTASLGNVIGGNGFDPFTVAGSTTAYLGHGIQLNNHTVTGTLVQNNFVGVGINGTAKVGNRQDGISLLGAKNSTISNNTVGFNTWGIFLQSDFGGTGQANQCSGNTISNNFVGTNSGLSADLGNGTRTIAAGDPVTDTDGGGIGLQHGSYSNTVSNNSVKFNRDGVVLRSSGNGGPPYLNTISGNTVSSNDFAGIKLTQGSGANTLQGAPGSANIVGGVGVGNTVTLNGTYGIELDSSQYNKILANTISSNTLDGINIHSGSKNNIIGGSAAEGNNISSNGGNGIQILNPNAAISNLNAINRNSISCNALRGIELNSLGNSNFAQPVFSGTPTSFTLTGAAGSWIELYALDGCNNCSSGSNTKLQGKTLVVEGNSPLTYTPAGAYAGLKNTDFTATASSAAPSTTNGATTSHNTSEFTACIALCVTQVAPTSASVDKTTICSNSTGNIVLTATGGSGGTLTWYAGGCGTGTAIGTGTTLTLPVPTSTTTYYARWEASGCTSSSCASTTVTVNTAPVIPTSASVDKQVICSNATGNIILTATGGSGGTLTWYKGACGTGTVVGTGTPLSIAVPTATTTYYVSWGIPGCTSTGCVSTTVTVNTLPTPPTSASVDRSTICSNSTGSIVLTATGGSGGTLTWYTGACGTGTVVGTGTPLTLAVPTTTTTYYASWGIAGCTSSSCASTTVTVNTAPVIPTSASVDKPVICSNATGSIVLTATGGSGGTLTWYSGACGTGTVVGTGTPLTIAVPTATTTYYASWGIPGCTSTGCVSTTVTVNTLPTPPTSASSDKNNFCSGAGGNIVLTAVGGSGGTVTWYAGGCGTGTSIGTGTPLSIPAPTVSTTYYARWENPTCTSSSCASVAVTVIPSVATPPTSASADRANICSNDGGTVTLTAVGGTGSTLSWYTGSCGGTLIGSGAVLTIPAPTATTTYFVRWEASGGCGNSACVSTIINVTPAPVTPASASADRTAICSNDGGSIILTAAGGSGGTLKWFSGSCGGTSVGTGTPLTIAAPTVTTTYFARWESPNCVASLCASVAVNVTTKPGTPTITANGPTSFCSGGSVLLTSSSAGTGTYQWKFNGTNITPGGTGSTYLASDSGNYTVVITPAGLANCPTASAATMVTVYPIPTASISSNGPTVFCEGGSVVLTASGNLSGTYQWKLNGTNVGTGSTYTASAAGNYTVVLTSANPANCNSPETSPITVTINLRPVTPGVTGNNSVCAETFGVVYSVTNTAGDTYNWTVPGTASIVSGQGTNTITVNFPVDATSGNITVTETNGTTNCADLTPSVFAVTINQRPVTQAVTGSGNVCAETFGVNYSVPTSSGKTYQWTVPGTASIVSGQGTNSIMVNFPADATSGDITVTETVSSTLCSDLTPSVFPVTINPRPVTQSVIGLDKVCAETNGVSYSVPNSGGSTFQWTVPGTASIVSGQGTNSIMVNFPANATSGDITVTETIAATTCADLTPSTFTVTINPRPVTQSIIGTNGLCAPSLGIPYSVTNNNGSTYDWTVPGTATIASGNGTNAITVDFPATATTGVITVTETITATGCADLTPSSFNVTINPQPTTPVVKATDTTIICTGGTVHLAIVSDLTGVTSIQWSDGSGIIPNATSSTYATSTAGTYSVTIFTTGTCSSTSAGSAVIVNQLPSVLISPVSGSGKCVGDTVTLHSNAQGGSGTFLYNWSAIQDPNWTRTSKDPSFFAPGITTDYIVTVQDLTTNSPSCSDSDTITLIVSSPYVSLNPTDSICKGTTLGVNASIINNTNTVTYLWQKVGTSPIGYLSDSTILAPEVSVPLNETRALLQYKLTIVDNGCTQYRDILIDVNSIPTIAVSTNDTVVCGGSSAALHALVTSPTSPKYLYNWLHIKDQLSGDDTLGRNISASTANDFSATVTTNPEANFFHVTLVDGHGCVGYSDTVIVNAFDKQNLMVPNLITPNNDHKNECFIIKDMNNFDILPGSSLEVYNRWGEAVFKAKNYSNSQPWCGGSLTDGVYYYHIKTGCGEQVIRGWIEILSNEAKF